MTQKLTTMLGDEQCRHSSATNCAMMAATTDNKLLCGLKSERTSEASQKMREAACFPFRFIPLSISDDRSTFVVSPESKQLLEREVSLAELENMTRSFYEKAFLDETLDRFIHSHDDPHARRFAKWIITTLAGNDLWNEDCRTRSKIPVILANGIEHVVHDLGSAHVAARSSHKRPESEVGRPFQLDECRIWMRLHYWALRETGLMKTSPSFADFYIRFIGHYIRIYEPASQRFARDSLRWSEDPNNIETYIASGRVMKDVLGLSLQEALLQIPAHEASDAVWPYITNAE